MLKARKNVTMRGLTPTNYYGLSIIFTIPWFFSSCHERNHSSTIKNESRVLSPQREFPIRVAVIRDGGTSMVEIHDSPREDLRKLFLVYDKVGEKVIGRIYKDANWPGSIDQSLSMQDGEWALSQIEKSLENYYGKQKLDEVKKSMDKILTHDEIERYMKDSELSNILEAMIALELVAEFKKLIQVDR